MRNPLSRIFFIFLAGLLLFTCSCDQEACFEETNAYVKASLYLYETGKLNAPDSITVYGVNKESSKIYAKSKSITKALLPLDTDAGSCSFVLRINGVNDTISFLYSSYPHLLSKACGYTYYHTISETPEHTTNLIDSVAINNNSITTLNAENIRIYY